MKEDPQIYWEKKRISARLFARIAFPILLVFAIWFFFAKIVPAGSVSEEISENSAAKTAPENAQISNKKLPPIPISENE